MIALNMSGSSAEIWTRLNVLCDVPPLPQGVKLQMLGHQMAALYMLARQYDYLGARILEIGTGQGGSADMISMAAPSAHVITLTPSDDERRIAEGLWAKTGRAKLTCRVSKSWDYAEADESRLPWDMIFCDGDHNAIAKDMAWFSRLRTGGLMLFHDYSPAECRSASPIVFDALNRAQERLGRPFDVVIVDHELIGMAGFYRREGEVL